MTRFPVHVVANENSPLQRALECGRAEQKTGDSECEIRLFVRRSSGSSGSELPADGIAGKWRDRIVLMGVSPVQSRFLLGHCFGANATPGGTAPLCFPDSSPRAGLGPCSRMRGLALGSRAHSQGFAQV
jgi:hypothetical protein